MERNQSPRPGDFLLSEANGTYSRENGILTMGNNLLAGAVLVYSLVCRDEAPRRSTVLIVIATAVPIAVLYWMAPLFVPFWLLISGLAIASEPGRRTPAAAT